MRIFQNRHFYQWAKKLGLSDEVLVQAISEIEAGHVEAHLAACLYKKRIALPGRGKRGGARTIIAMKQGENAFFIFGFAKNEQASISPKELEALKRLAGDYLVWNGSMLERALKEGILVEVVR